MSLHSRNSVLLISILCFLHSGNSAEDPTYSQLSENSRSYGECDGNALFPEPPCCGISNKLSGRIHGGKITELNEFPWIVFICMGSCSDDGGGGGGTLINSRWVLTAAHNVAENAERGIQLHLGEWSRTADHNCADKVCNSKHKIVQFDKMIVHELYNSLNKNNPEHDVALLHLTESVTFTDYIKPICLPLNIPEEHSFANQMAVVAGWGLTEDGSASNVLLKTSVKVWDSISCQQHATNVSLQICAGGEEGISFCVGDSGGPLVLQSVKDKQQFYLQVGLVSYGVLPCGQSRNPGIYASIPAYMKWIKNKILSFQ